MMCFDQGILRKRSTTGAGNEALMQTQHKQFDRRNRDFAIHSEDGVSPALITAVKSPRKFIKQYSGVCETSINRTRKSGRTRFIELDVGGSLKFSVSLPIAAPSSLGFTKSGNYFGYGKGRNLPLRLVLFSSSGHVSAQRQERGGRNSTYCHIRTTTL